MLRLKTQQNNEILEGEAVLGWLPDMHAADPLSSPALLSHLSKEHSLELQYVIQLSQYHPIPNKQAPSWGACCGLRITTVVVAHVE